MIDLEKKIIKDIKEKLTYKEYDMFTKKVIQSIDKVVERNKEY